MLKYSIIVQYSDEDTAFVARVPELRGCMAHGTTPEEALREVRVAQQLWLEVANEVGEEIPSPSALTYQK